MRRIIMYAQDYYMYAQDYYVCAGLLCIVTVLPQSCSQISKIRCGFYSCVLATQVDVKQLYVMKRCSPLSRALINTYRSDNINLYINGETLLSQKGTTEGDLLAMAMYAIAMVPLIERIANENVKQTWCADDAAVGGNVVSIKKWWDNLQKLGPYYGYFPNLKKKLDS